MVWDAISSFGKTPIVFVENTMDSQVYKKILQKNYFPILKKFNPENPFIFQQDNASVHTSNETLSFFEKKGTLLLDWPPHSPDLNPIENIWGLMV